VTAAIVSVVVQISSVTVNYVNYETRLRQIFPTDWRDPLRFGPPAQSLRELPFSPVLGQWQLMGQDLVANSDLAWLQSDGQVAWPILVTGVVTLLVLAVGLYHWWTSEDRLARNARTLRVVTGTGLLACTVFMGTWLQVLGAKAVQTPSQQALQSILEEIESEAQPGDAVVTVAPYHYPAVMNGYDGKLPIWGLATDSMLHPEASRALERLLAERDQLWFVTAGLQPSDPNNSVERWLTGHAYKGDDRWFEAFRLVRFGTPRGCRECTSREVEMTLGRSGYQVALETASFPATAQPGRVMPIEAGYRLMAPVPDPLHWFVQLWDSNGVAVAFLDTAPQGGYRDMSRLPAQERVVERLGLVIPEDIEPGLYQLVAGLYAPTADGERLRIEQGQDHIVLGQVAVAAP
jgi:hypothetical protein